MDEIDVLRQRLDGLENQIDQMRQESHEREVKRLRWGVTALGAIVMAMGSWIWSEVKHLVSLSVGK